jgi:exonuclease III
MSITIATFNIWFDEYYLEERVFRIISEIIESRPKISVIALQEVTPASYKFFKQTLSRYYLFTDIKTNQTYDTIILVNRDYKINKIISQRFSQSKMQRNFTLVCITHLETKKNYLISSAHLESEFNKSCDQLNHYKISQFIESFNILEEYLRNSNLEYEMAIFMGDTNICNEEDEIFSKKIPDNWVDFFIEFGSPKHLEFTYDYSKNNNTFYRAKSRLDRIYYKKLNSTMEPYTFSFLGQEPYRRRLYSSDHFGVVANFSEI